MNLPFDYPESEVVLGLAYPVGTDVRIIENALKDHLKKFSYSVNEIRISEFFKDLGLGIKLPNAPEYARINSRMKAGNKARELSRRSDFLALAAMAKINEGRPISSDSLYPGPVRRTTHIIRSLKRPEEVLTLRRVYGPGFYLIGVFATEGDRKKFLQNDKNIKEGRAVELIDRDQEEKEEYGQRMAKTFQLADVFLHLHSPHFKNNLWRFLDLIFGNPYITPSRDENAMFMAYAAALRSGALGRQVGAVITNAHEDLISVGCNDVPAYGGGMYWPGKSDQRDIVLGEDSNDRRRSEIIDEIIDLLGITKESGKKNAKAVLRKSSLAEITEYGRIVHAEMEALLAANRSGVSPRKGTLYSTTFPCHNCTRHIIAVGIKRVVYIEPYPKSRAEELHFDAIEIDPETADPGKQSKVKFEHFVGVGPRRYMDLFSVNLSSGYPLERKKDGKIVKWTQETASLRVPMLPASYLRRERTAAAEVASIGRKAAKPFKRPGRRKPNGNQKSTH